MEKYLITGSLERLPMASKTPRGKQKMIAKIEMTKVKNNPPHSLVSTGINPKNPPENNIKDKIGNGMIKNKNKYFFNFKLVMIEPFTEVCLNTGAEFGLT